MLRYVPQSNKSQEKSPPHQQTTVTNHSVQPTIQGHILQLQRTIGNRAVTQLIAQAIEQRNHQALAPIRPATGQVAQGMFRRFFGFGPQDDQKPKEAPQTNLPTTSAPTSSSTFSMEDSKEMQRVAVRDWEARLHHLDQQIDQFFPQRDQHDENIREAQSQRLQSRANIATLDNPVASGGGQDMYDSVKTGIDIQEKDQDYEESVRIGKQHEGRLPKLLQERQEAESFYSKALAKYHGT